jgi:hypothetical protein
MPLHEWAGDFGWGYDGVNLFAPTHAYGTPDDARRFVDAAHGLGLGVILDVVYNHCGPAGCALRQFADTYPTERYGGEWGPSTDFDGPGTEGVREYVAANAAYWIDELHCDGLRLDATQSIHDHSGRYPEHVIARIAREARQAAARRILLSSREQTGNAAGPKKLGLDASERRRTTARWWPPAGGAGLLHRDADAAGLIARSAGATSIRDSGTAGRSTGGAHRPSTSPRPPSSPTWRTDQIANSFVERAPSCSPGTPARHDPGCVARSRDAAPLHGPGVGRLHAVPLLRGPRRS